MCPQTDVKLWIQVATRNRGIQITNVEEVINVNCFLIEVLGHEGHDKV